MLVPMCASASFTSPFTRVCWQEKRVALIPLLFKSPHQETEKPLEVLSECLTSSVETPPFLEMFQEQTNSSLLYTLIAYSFCV